MLQAIVRNFLRGTLVVVPVFVTVYIICFLFVLIDGWVNVEPLLNRRIPGLGVVVTVVAITLVGVLTRTVFTRWLFNATDRLFRRLPFIKLLYTSIRDLIEAFVGDERRFERPVLVRLGEESDAAVVGFLTRDDLGGFGLADRVAVYVPQSFNFAGNLLIVPRDRIRPLDVPSSAAMTLLVSGGIVGQDEGSGLAPQHPLPSKRRAEGAFHRES